MIQKVYVGMLGSYTKYNFIFVSWGYCKYMFWGVGVYKLYMLSVSDDGKCMFNIYIYILTEGVHACLEDTTNVFWICLRRIRNTFLRSCQGIPKIHVLGGGWI